MLHIVENEDWELIDEGIEEIDVYDIETENHMFFGNDILVHNSIYVDVTDVLNKYYEAKPEADVQMATDFVDRFAKQIEKKALIPLFNKIKNECDCSDVFGLYMDREAITIPNRNTGFSGLWICKKHYFLYVMDMEGYRYETPHEKKMGLYSITANCPDFIKPWYEQVIKDFIESGVEKARKTVKEFKKIFYKKDIASISFPKSVSDVDRYVDPSTGLAWEGEWKDEELGKTRKGGVPVNSKAAINFNYLINKFGLQKKYQYIRSGDRIRFCYLKENPYHMTVVGFNNDILPPEFGLDKYVDIDTHYEKLFYKPVEDIFKACNYTIKKTHTIDEYF